jgi:hypothetical protein
MRQRPFPGQLVREKKRVKQHGHKRCRELRALWECVSAVVGAHATGHSGPDRLARVTAEQTPEGAASGGGVSMTIVVRLVEDQCRTQIRLKLPFTAQSMLRE